MHKIRTKMTDRISDDVLGTSKTASEAFKTPVPKFKQGFVRYTLTRTF